MELLNTLQVRDHPELRSDVRGHELRYESQAYPDCGFFIASPGDRGVYEKRDFNSFKPAALSFMQHPNLVYSEKGWIQYVEGYENRSPAR